MASSGRDGSFFDDLNLPPAAADFLQTWYRHLLAAIAILVVVILGWTFTKQFTAARADRASEQLTMAMQIENQAARAAALEEVASSYRRTGAGIWSRIEIAHLAREAGELEQAAQTYEELLGIIPRQDPRQPMVKLNLAQVLSELDGMSGPPPSTVNWKIPPASWPGACWAAAKSWPAGAMRRPRRRNTAR